MSERPKILKGIRRCLSDAYSLFQEAMDALDEIGKATVGPSMTPLLGGYAMRDPSKYYRTALIKLDSAENALHPLALRLKEGRVNSTHFRDEKAMVLLKDLTEFDYQVLINLLSDRRGRESVWYRLDELSKKAREIHEMVSAD
jgi:hypothetical protein